jgi:hypothetical protein
MIDCNPQRCIHREILPTNHSTNDGWAEPRIGLEKGQKQEIAPYQGLNPGYPVRNLVFLLTPCKIMNGGKNIRRRPTTRKLKNTIVC